MLRFTSVLLVVVLMAAAVVSHGRHRRNRRSCRSGYQRSTNGRSCVDIDECKSSTACKKSLKCVNTQGSYRCDCPTGRIKFFGDRCVSQCPLGIFRKVGCFSSRTYPISKMTELRIEPAGHKHKHGHRRGDPLAYDVEPDIQDYDLDLDFNVEWNDPHGRHKHGHKHGSQLTLTQRACMCAAEALKKGYTYFSIRSLTKCMAGTYYNSLVAAFKKPKSTKCYNKDKNKCNDRDTSICYGERGIDYVYILDVCLLGNGGCAHNCKFHGQTKAITCSCRAGYALAANRKSCIDIDECAISKPCIGGTCRNTGGSFKCYCPNGYTLLGDRKTCKDIDECAISKPCIGGTCRNTGGSFKCYCPNGYTLLGDRKTCKDIDECTTSKPCAGTCKNTRGSYVCFCPKGFKVHGRYCKDINECETIKPCAHQCLNTRGSYKCFCPRGFTVNGGYCKDIDECKLGTSGCRQTCHNTAGSFKCGCGYGYRLSIDGKTCLDVDECALGKHLCEHECVNKLGGYFCRCKTGFTLDSNSKNCTDINECSKNNGGCKDLCHNFAGGHQCGCQAGYTLLDDKKSCEDINECQVVQNGGCHQKCKNTAGSYECVCYPGYVESSDGQKCTDINECGTSKGGCDHNCTNSPGSFNCICRHGYVLDVNGLTCNDVDECVRLDKGGCKGECVNLIGSYKCTCGIGYKLDEDQRSCIDIDECARKPSVCSQQCKNSIGTYSCSCDDGYVLEPKDFKTCHDVNECDSSSTNNCEQVCNNKIGTYECSCNTDYVLQSNGRSCKPREMRWPKGSYGILSLTCPDGWKEFTHCMDTNNWFNADELNGFSLGYYGDRWSKERDEDKNVKCGKRDSFVTFRYCFKGPDIPSRTGGFATTSAETGVGYVIRNINTNCSTYGKPGGSVRMDTDDSFNADAFGNNGLNGKVFTHYRPNGYHYDNEKKSIVELQFCKIGEAEKSATAGVMEVGSFPQKFGFFIHNDEACPTLRSPTGYLHGVKQIIILDLEDGLNTNVVNTPAPFKKVGKGNMKGAVCEYDPNNGKDST